MSPVELIDVQALRACRTEIRAHVLARFEIAAGASHEQLSLALRRVCEPTTGKSLPSFRALATASLRIVEPRGWPLIERTKGTPEVRCDDVEFQGAAATKWRQ